MTYGGTLQKYDLQPFTYPGYSLRMLPGYVKGYVINYYNVLPVEKANFGLA